MRKINIEEYIVGKRMLERKRQMISEVASDLKSLFKDDVLVTNRVLYTLDLASGDKFQIKCDIVPRSKKLAAYLYAYGEPIEGNVGDELLDEDVLPMYESLIKMIVGLDKTFPWLGIKEYFLQYQEYVQINRNTRRI